ncbi:MAG: response regulator transcription factor [Propionicimonas sp.]
MRVLLADDHHLMVEGLRNLLEAHGVEVVGAAEDGYACLRMARELSPDVILMDIGMPRCDGLAATRLVKSELPQTKVVILTASADDRDLFEAVKSGAAGYLLKSMDAADLIEALDNALHDVPPLAPGLAARLLAEFARSVETTPAHVEAVVATSSAGSSPLSAHGLGEQALTLRQAEVLALLAQGFSYKEVAVRVSLTPRTVKYHTGEIMRKLHLRNRAQVLAYAGSLGLGPDPHQE